MTTSQSMVLVSTVLIGFGAFPVSGQPNSTIAPSPALTGMGMTLVAPLFVENELRTSIMTLVNDSPARLDLDIVLYGMTGIRLHARDYFHGSPFRAGCSRERSPWSGAYDANVWFDCFGSASKVHHGCATVHYGTSRVNGE